jgi:hypothetical protein
MNPPSCHRSGNRLLHKAQVDSWNDFLKQNAACRFDCVKQYCYYLVKRHPLIHEITQLGKQGVRIIHKVPLDQRGHEAAITVLWAARAKKRVMWPTSSALMKRQSCGVLAKCCTVLFEESPRQPAIAVGIRLLAMVR